MWLRAREPNPLIIRFAIADVLQMQSRALHIPKVGLVVDAGKGLFARPSDHSNGELRVEDQVQPQRRLPLQAASSPLSHSPWCTSPGPPLSEWCVQPTCASRQFRRSAVRRYL
jgi:hypothetical protein